MSGFTIKQKLTIQLQTKVINLKRLVLSAVLASALMAGCSHAQPKHETKVHRMADGMVYTQAPDDSWYIFMVMNNSGSGLEPYRQGPLTNTALPSTGKWAPAPAAPSARALAESEEEEQAVDAEPGEGQAESTSAESSEGSTSSESGGGDGGGGGGD